MSNFRAVGLPFFFGPSAVLSCRDEIDGYHLVMRLERKEAKWGTRNT